MTKCVEQWYCIKFCQKLGDPKAETIWKIQQAFGDDAMGAMQIKEWFNCFKDGGTLADSNQRSGRPSTSRNANVIENVHSLFLEDRRLTVREIADEAGISTGSAHSILAEDLHMCRVVAKFVPKLLLQEHQQLHLEAARDMLECANGDPEFLKTVITGDEMWVYGYDPETKVQSSQWKHSSSPRPKKAQQVQSKVKVLPTVLTIAGLCVTVMHQQAKLSTKNIICKSSVIFVMQFSARDRTCGPHAIGNCIMSMPRLIHHT
jgi:AraC-like DNA-binding protein